MTTLPRIIFFSHETTWSGAPIQLLHLVTWLKERGWEVAVAVPKATTAESGPISAELARAGVQIFPVLDLSVPPDQPALRALCAQFDLVVANTLVMWAAVRAANEEGVPSLWYIHESLVAEHLIAHIPEIKPTLALADLLVMPTRRTAQLYAQLTDQIIEVVPYGIPAVTLAGEATPNDSTKTRFLLLGTYEPRKGQDVFLEAIKQSGAMPGCGATFQMAGRVLDRTFYEAIAAQAASLPNVELQGPLGHEDALRASAAADVLVCASRDETMPIAILEAMSLGKAIVTTTVGGVSEWLRDGVNALLVPPEESAALAAALRRCLDEPGLIASLGQNARRTFAENFSIDELGERFSLLFEKLRQPNQP
ncbi:MAG: glycosyltransferase family 4 protein [Spartobacteria bacterium]